MKGNKDTSHTFLTLSLDRGLLYPQEKTLGTHGGPQSWSGEEKNIVSLPDIEA
jgi:hypothetical protein